MTRLPPWAAEAFSACAGVLFLAQSWSYARSQASLLDEGAYLVKGYLFVTGQYFPYQDYGPWTNHMPLAFLIPGVVQRVLSPGLRSGRTIAVFWGMLTLLGLWLLARRLGGRGWATLTVWSVALNPALIKLYSLANSQSLVACQLVWILVLVLGERRREWHLLAGAFLAGILWVTRINMAPVLLLLVVYIFWQHGWKAGLLSALAGGLPVLVGHLVFYPGILRVWAHWLPADVLPFLRPWAHPPGSDPSWNPPVTREMRWLSFWQGVRFHFFNLLGVLGAWLFWQPQRKWRSAERFKMTVFLSALFIVLFTSHLWAALGNNYCVYCFGVYLSFFSWLGLLLLVISFPNWKREASTWRSALAAGTILLLSMGVWWNAYAEGIARERFSEAGNAVLKLLEVKLPSMASVQGEANRIELSALLRNKLGLTEEAFEKSVRKTLALLVGAIFAILILGIAWLILNRLEQSRAGLSFGLVGFAMFLGLGLVLSPSRLLGGGFRTYDCSGNVIASYEAVGRHLAQVIPRGAWVYWRGGDSAVPLLYLPEVHIFPAQINGDYSYRLGGNPDALARYGFWSEALAHQWAERADFILIEEQQYRGWLAEYVESHNFDELAPSPPTEPCRPGSAIHIFRRIP